MEAPYEPLLRVEKGEASAQDLAALVAVFAWLRQRRQDTDARPGPPDPPAARPPKATWRRLERRPYHGVPTSWNTH
ncbi:acyl-CoA carboxylase subunit epsilon [Streptomyces flavalbus]|uniref:Acyl-CoA carboxylase subunit epsilon n=1 Tax=Streptomyces flavalbus TaxID=2665155 RepID=A0ABW2WLI8_9ACTN